MKQGLERTQHSNWAKAWREKPVPEEQGLLCGRKLGVKDREGSCGPGQGFQCSFT